MKNIVLILILTISTYAFAGTIQAAQYEVPTSRVELKKSSLFAIQKISVERKKSQIKIKYLIPQELTGTPNEMEFTGQINNNSGKLQSEYGEMNCICTTTEMMCNVSYQNLNFDNELARQILSRKFTAQDLANRFELQDRFSTDPIGIIHIQFKNYDLGFQVRREERPR